MIEYWNENNGKITIDTDSLLERAKMDAVKKSCEENQPRCILKLIVTLVAKTTCIIAY